MKSYLLTHKHHHQALSAVSSALVIVAIIGVGTVSLMAYGVSRGPGIATNPSNCCIMQTSTQKYSTRTLATHASNVSQSDVLIPGYPARIAVDSNTVYITDLFLNKVTVVNSRTDKVVTDITLPGSPSFGIAFDPFTNLVYVPHLRCVNLVNVSNSCNSPAHSTNAAIAEIDAGTNKVVGEIKLDVSSLAVNVDSNVLWAISDPASPEYLYAIDAQSGSLLANISLGATPFSVSVNPNTNMVYLAGCKSVPLPCLGAEIIMVNGANYKIQSSVSLSSFDALNFGAVVDPTNNVIYTIGEARNLTFVAIDGSSGSVLYSSDLAGSCAGAGGGSLAVNTFTNQVYVSSYQPYFLVLNGTNGKIANMLKITNSPYVVFDSSTNGVYLTTSNSLEIFPANVITSGPVNSSVLPQNECFP